MEIRLCQKPATNLLQKLVYTIGAVHMRERERERDDDDDDNDDDDVSFF